MTIHSIKFSIPAAYITTIQPNNLSTNGPYIAAHLGRINKEDKSGQVYYQRPYSIYNKQQKQLVIYLDHNQGTIHKNNNKLCKDVLFSGTIEITNFEYGKSNPNQIIYVDIKVINNTEKPLHSINLYNGLREKEFTAFGKIVYYLFTTKYWIEKKRHFYKPLPIKKILPATNLILKLSENN